jgi:hypothetical protein
MRRLALALLLALFALPIAACGGGGGDPFVGGLIVCNDFDSFEDIELVEVEDEFGFVFAYDVEILPDECDFIDDFHPGFYLVTVTWSDLTFDDEVVEIVDDFDTEVTFLN